MPSNELEPTAEDQGQGHIAIVEESAWMGPLPHPVILQQYQDINPSFAERIVVQFEAEGNHRRRIEEKGLDLEHWAKYLGIFATVVIHVVAFLVSAQIVIFTGEWVGGSFGPATILIFWLIVMLRARPNAVNNGTD